jgi:hypothetical protein
MRTMAGNPKDSEWYSTPRTVRKRKGIEVTLSDAAQERLERMAKARKVSRSVVVEDLIMGAPMRAPKE